MPEAADRPLRDRVLCLLAPGLALGLGLSVGGSLLQLAVPLYSLQIFDRVLPSGHLATLLLLSAMGAATLAVLGALDALRNAVLQRLGTRLGARLGPDILGAAAVNGESAGLALHELETCRQVVSGPVAQAIFELPWLPLALLAAWLLHPDLALLALVATVALLSLGFVNDRLTRQPLRRAFGLAIEAERRGEAVTRHADVVRAMGLLPALERRFHDAQAAALVRFQRAGETGAALGGLVKAVRLAVQAAAMGLGAWLVVRHELTGGGLMAGSILVSRALAPIEQIVGSWKGLVQLRDSLGRLDRHLAAGTPATAPMRLPAPVGRLELEAVGVRTAEGRDLLAGISLDLPAGTVVAVVGPSAAGKTTLCRVIAGCLAPTTGRARLDGADYAHHRPEDRGPHVGYLPQEAALFAGTVAENIARMAVEPDAEEVVRAARLAGVHDAVLHLPRAYDTELREGGLPLSGGQRQRIGLARAVYGRPRLVVLDEPNANLDAAGEAALVGGLAELRVDGVTVVLVTHRPSLVTHADLVLVLEEGRVARLGPREDVMAALMRPARVA